MLGFSLSAGLAAEFEARAPDAEDAATFARARAAQAAPKPLEADAFPISAERKSADTAAPGAGAAVRAATKPFALAGVEVQQWHGLAAEIGAEYNGMPSPEPRRRRASRPLDNLLGGQQSQKEAH